MMHWKAKLLIPSLFDEGLSEEEELDLRVHVASCARCRRMERELAASEALLRRLPSSLLPIEPNPASYGRLVSLSRWHDDPALATPDRWRAPVLTAVSMLAVLMMAVTLGAWSPIVSSYTGGLELGGAVADSNYLTMTWTPNPH